MRDCIEYSKHIYTSKSSAMRAAKNAIGREVGVVNPQIGNGFDAILIITENMLDVSPCENGWRWSFSYGQEDVTPYTPCGDNVPSGEACASAIETTTADTSSVAHNVVLPDLIHRIEQYRGTLRRLYDSGDFKGHSSHMASIFPVLDADCKAIGIDFRDVDTVLDIIGVTSESTNPLTIAEVVIDAEPFGLDSRVRPRLIELARLRGKLPEYYLNKVQGNLQRCAV